MKKLIVSFKQMAQIEALMSSFDVLPQRQYDYTYPIS